MKFRKKPIVIDADVWDPENKDAVALAGVHGWKLDFVGNVYINTLEGTMIANVGDYIIRGVKGEYYPCKPDIFNLTYERVRNAFDYEAPQSEDDFNSIIEEIKKLRKVLKKACYYLQDDSAGEAFVKTDVIDAGLL